MQIVALAMQLLLEDVLHMVVWKHVAHPRIVRRDILRVADAPSTLQGAMRRRRSLWLVRRMARRMLAMLIVVDRPRE